MWEGAFLLLNIYVKINSHVISSNIILLYDLFFKYDFIVYTAAPFYLDTEIFSSIYHVKFNYAIIICVCYKATFLYDYNSLNRND